MLSYSAALDTSYYCAAEACIVGGDMPRFQAIYQNYPTKLIRQTVMFEKHYLVLDYETNVTTVSKLDYCIRFDPVDVPRIIKVDYNNPQNTIEKLETLMLFS